MVVRQILVLFVLVRIQVGQQRPRTMCGVFAFIRLAERTRHAPEMQKPTSEASRGLWVMQMRGGSAQAAKQAGANPGRATSGPANISPVAQEEERLS